MEEIANMAPVVILFLLHIFPLGVLSPRNALCGARALEVGASLGIPKKEASVS